MARYITVRLTEKEAEEALAAIGYATDYPQCLDSWGEGKDEKVRDSRGVAAAERAARKIREALHSRPS